MGKKPSVPVDRERYKSYERNAKSFEEEALDAVKAKRWNPAGALYVLATIAWCDAVTVAMGGKKSAGDNHSNAAALLAEIVQTDPVGKKEAVKNFRMIIAEKTAVSYGAEAYDQTDIERIEKSYALFAGWCKRALKTGQN